MEPIFSLLAPLTLVLIGYTVGSVKIIRESNEALVERLGQYSRKLSPGVNFIIPFVDNIVVEDTTRERLLEIDPPLQAITKDDVAVTVDGVVYWRVLDLERAYYTVEDLERAIENLVSTAIPSAIGELELMQTFASRDKINEKLLYRMDEATAEWGIKITRVEVRDIIPPQRILEALELERAAESKKRAAISEAEGNVESIRIISNAIRSQSNSREVLNFLVAQRYVDANEKLSESKNAKLLFLDPHNFQRAVGGLLVHAPEESHDDDSPDESHHHH